MTRRSTMLISLVLACLAVPAALSQNSGAHPNHSAPDTMVNGLLNPELIPD